MAESTVSTFVAMRRASNWKVWQDLAIVV